MHILIIVNWKFQASKRTCIECSKFN